MNDECSPGRSPKDVAIIGMACVFPKAPDAATFWENIVGGVDTIGEPNEEWGARFVLDPHATSNDRVYTTRGGYVDGLLRFDPLAFGIMPRAVDGGEPEHFVALKLAHDALVDAGYGTRPFDRERTEIILGRGTYVNRGLVNVFQHAIVVDQTIRVLASLHPEWSDEQLAAIKRELKAQLPPFNAETAPAVSHSVMCGRIANRLDLMGSAFTVDAACASSLIAVDLAMTDLVSGKCDLALAGGIQISTTYPVALLFCQLGALSRAGTIRPFHPEADGTLLGEGAGIVVLKRLADAERDGDRVYAVLKGVGTASDGRANGILAPRVEGEELAMRRAYARAEVAPATVGLLEAHGTGTPVGDAVELEAMSRLFPATADAAPRCAVGSVKSMIGHTIPAAGIAGIIKAALALYHKVLPPTLHAETANAKLAATSLYLNTAARPWIHGDRHGRRAAVSAFGFGGINAHAVLEEHAGGELRESFQRRRGSEVFVVTGPTRDALRTRAGQLAAFAQKNPAAPLREIAWAVNGDRAPDSRERLALVATSVEDLARKLTHAAERLADPRCERIRERSGVYYVAAPLAAEGGVAFLFPGEGAQYAGMLADLCLHVPEVRAWFDLMDRAFREHGRGFVPSDVIFPLPGAAASDRGSRLWEMASAIEAVFTANQALHSLLTSLGVRPDAIVGHSTGEYSALLASGAVEADDDDALIRLVLDGNRVTEDVARNGAVASGVLLAVGPATPSIIEAAIARANGALHLAMDNCRNQVVLFGSEDAVERAVPELTREGAVCQRLPFGRPYHTPLFAPVAERLATYFETARFAAPRIPLYSCATAAKFPDDAAGARRVALAQWTMPVRFRETIERMYADGIRMFVEVGPRGSLTSFVDDILGDQRHLAVAANVTRRSGLDQIHHVVAMLASHGVPVDLAALYRSRCSGQVTAEEIWSGVPASAKPDRSIAISLELPRLDIPPRPRALAAPAAAVNGAEAPATPPAPAARPTAVPSIPAAPSVPSPRAVPDALRAPLATPPLPPTAVPVARVMREHLDTMDRFLSTEEDVMTAYLRSGTARRSSPPTALRRGLPFVARITREVPGREVDVERTFALAGDAFLRDHTLGPKISDADPGLTPLPVVPLAVAVEALVEAASLVVPGTATTVRDVRVTRWLPILAPTTVRLSARRRANTSDVDVALFEGRDDQTPLVQGVVGFDGQRAPAPAMAPLTASRPGAWSGERLYAEGERHGMFHGPTFRGVVSVDGVAAEGADATLRAQPTVTLAGGVDGAGLLADPLVLDAAGQVLGFWTADWLGRAFVVFPVGFESLELHGGPLAAGERARCRLRVTLADDTHVRADFDVLDVGGQPRLRVRGWTVQRFDLPERMYDFRLAPRDAVPSMRWDAPLARVPGAEDLRVMRLEAPGRFLDAAGGVWRDALAHLTLGRRERGLWNDLPPSGPRRTEWLLGRVVGKDAVRLWLRERRGAIHYPADLELLPDVHGRPEVTGGGALSVPPVAVSLAHTGNLAVAVAGPGREGLGIDIEEIAPRPDGFESMAFTGSESALLGRLADRDEWITRLWCAKEAAAKACGRGLITGPHDVLVEQVEPATGEVRMRPTGALAQALGDAASAIVAWTMRDGRHVVAVARRSEHGDRADIRA